MSADSEEEFDLVTPDEGDIDLEVIDATPAQDRDRQPLSEEELSEDIPEDELGSYSKKVQKRIAQMSERFHDQRRKNEAAERERDQAVQLARNAIEHLNASRRETTAYERFGVSQAKSSAEAEHAQAIQKYKLAFESADADKMAEASGEIASAKLKLEQYSNYEPQEPQPYAVPQAPQPQNNQQVQDTKFLGWQDKNKDWFMRDQQMTDTAIGWHARQDPSFVGSDKYYQDLDRYMRDLYPNKFGGSAPRQETQRLAPVTTAGRSSSPSSGGKRKVTLTTDEVNLARRLGLTPQQYAAEKLKLEQN